MEDAGTTGFTLFELLLGLALAALLAGLAVPAMARFLDQARLHSAAEALAQELRQARNHALNHQQTTWFSVHIGNGHWCYGWGDQAHCDCRQPAAVDGACRSGSTGRYRVQRRSSLDFPSVTLGLSHSTRPRSLRFSPVRGTASAESFSVRNRSGEMRVVISPLGRVRICAPKQAAPSPC